MTIDMTDIIESITKSFSRIDYIHLEDIPSISLYMDQVTTFMDSHLASTKRHTDDKILTKTMINNYTKNRLLPPPEKKKYSKEHLLILVLIYHFKNILSINDIQTLLKPITEKYFHSSEEFDLSRIYLEIMEMELGQVDQVRDNVADCFEKSQSMFTDAPEGEQDFFQLFSFICMLSFDVYMKKQIIEQLVDHMPDPKKPASDK